MPTIIVHFDLTMARATLVCCRQRRFTYFPLLFAVLAIEMNFTSSTEIMNCEADLNLTIC